MCCASYAVKGYYLKLIRDYKMQSSCRKTNYCNINSAHVICEMGTQKQFLIIVSFSIISAYLPTLPPNHPTYLPTYLSIYLSIYLSMSVCLSIYLFFIYPSTYIYICLSVYLSLWSIYRSPYIMLGWFRLPDLTGITSSVDNNR